jgi:hypothetical protein
MLQKDKIKTKRVIFADDVTEKKSTATSAKFTATSAKNLTFCLPHQQKGVNQKNKFCRGIISKK